MANTSKQKRLPLAEEPCAPTSHGPSAVGLYIRVSTDRQAKEGDSLEEQESELKSFCIHRKYQIVKIYVERGHSAGTTNRPEYQNLIADIKAQKLDTIIVKKIDRLSRSLLDFEQLMTLFQAHEVGFISIRENFDTTTAMGKAMLRIALIFAQLEREQTAERVADVMQYRATLGHYNGGIVPFGYIVANKELLISAQQKPIVELVFKHFLDSTSVHAVANYLNDAKVKPPYGTVWLPSRVEQLLKNPIYKGSVVWQKKVYPGLHSPIIAPSVWDKVQAIFDAQRKHIPRGKSQALLQRLAVCGLCQMPLIPSFAYNRFKTKYQYYRCGSTQHGKHRREMLKCTFKYVAFATLHAQVQMALVSLTTSAQMNLLDEQVATHNQVIEGQIQTLTAQIQLAQTELKQVKTKKNEYVDVLISQSFSTQDRLRVQERLNELDQEERQLQGHLATSQLEQHQAQDSLIATDSLKHTLVMLRDQPNLEEAKYKAILHTLLTKMEVFSDYLIFQLKALPWTVKVPIDSP